MFSHVPWTHHTCSPPFSQQDVHELEKQLWPLTRRRAGPAPLLFSLGHRGVACRDVGVEAAAQRTRALCSDYFWESERTTVESWITVKRFTSCKWDTGPVERPKSFWDNLTKKLFNILKGQFTQINFSAHAKYFLSLSPLSVFLLFFILSFSPLPFVFLCLSFSLSFCLTLSFYISLSHFVLIFLSLLSFSLSLCISLIFSFFSFVSLSRSRSLFLLSFFISFFHIVRYFSRNNAA